jgi:hypothetical protein
VKTLTALIFLYVLYGRHACRPPAAWHPRKQTTDFAVKKHKFWPVLFQKDCSPFIEGLESSFENATKDPLIFTLLIVVEVLDLRVLSFAAFSLFAGALHLLCGDDMYVVRWPDGSLYLY